MGASHPPRQLVIALIGDLSWESSAEYYRIINQTIRSRFGGRPGAAACRHSTSARSKPRTPKASPIFGAQWGRNRWIEGSGIA
jgi:hypothetical protein